MDLARPPFIEEQSWADATDAQRHDWFRYARDLMELLEDPRFRNVAGRWVDELAGVSAATITEQEAATSPQPGVLMAIREGKRQIGLLMQVHMQAVAPKMWMRALSEMKDARVRVHAGGATT